MTLTDTFDVVIVGFDERDEPAEHRLQRAFGIERAVARELLSRLPATVQRGVPRVRAEYFRRALIMIGAHAEVRDQAGLAVEAEGSQDPTPEPAARFAPAAQTPADPPATEDTAPAWRPAAFPIDPMSRTVAMSSPPAHMPATSQPARRPPSAPPQFDPNALLAAAAQTPQRGSANSTLHEARSPGAPSAPRAAGAAPVFAQPKTLFDLNAPGSPAHFPTPPAPPPPAPAPAPTFDPFPTAAAVPSSYGQQPAAAAGAGLVTRLPSGVFDAPAEADEVHAPRDPSSVFDPPPKPVQRGQRAAAPGMRTQPESSPPPAPMPALVDRAQPQQARWRPESAPPPSAAAVAFDPTPDGGAMRMLSPWEQPGNDSMAEPKPALRSSRPPRPLGSDRSPPAAAGPRARAPRPRPPVASAAAEPQHRQPAPQRAAAERAPTQRSLSGADTRSFWETLPEALVVPFAGPGLYWIAALSAWSVAVGFLGLLANFVFLLGLFVMFFANTSLLAFTCDYYRVCLWAPVSGEKAPERAPDFDPVRILNSYIKSGVHLILFMIASQVPLIWWFVHNLHEDGLASLLELPLNPITWLLFLLPYYYWPMGVGLTALSNNFAAIWNVPAGFRAIARAPLEYTTIVAIGMVALFLSFIGMWLFGSMLGVTGAVLSGTVGFPLAISHGLQGALMGHLVRARGEIFEE